MVEAHPELCYRPGGVDALFRLRNDASRNGAAIPNSIAAIETRIVPFSPPEAISSTSGTSASMAADQPTMAPG